MEYIKKLINEAIISRKKAYAPYSKFKVGAALLTESGKIYGGFNIECASYPAGNCAERTALFRAIFDEHRKFKALAVVGGIESETDVFSSFCPPCGVCRQVLREFCNPNDRLFWQKAFRNLKNTLWKNFFPKALGLTIFIISIKYKKFNLTLLFGGYSFEFRT